MKLEFRNTARRDFRSYMLLLVGLVFVIAGATVPPASNCDESGRACAPWLVPLAFCLGVLATAAGLALLFRNDQWGSRIDLEHRQLFWWDTRQSRAVHQLFLDDVARIQVRLVSDGSDNLFFYDRQGALMPIPKDEVFPHPYDSWATDLVAQFPHISLNVESN